MKQAAREAIAKRLEAELSGIRRQLRMNAQKMHELAKANEMLKRQRPELQHLIRELQPLPGKKA